MEAYFPPNSTYGPHKMASSENGSCVFFSTDQIILMDLKPYLEHCKHPVEARTSDSTSWRTPNNPVQDNLPPLIPRSDKNLTDGKFQAIDLSPHGDQVVTGDSEGEVSLFSINNDNGDRLFTKLKKHDGHKVGVNGKEKLSRVTAISWSKADPNIVVSGDGDGKIVAWTLSSNTVANYKPTTSIEIIVLRTHPSKRGIIGVGYMKGLIMIFDVCDKFSVLMKTKASDTDIQDFSWSPVPEILEISSEDPSNTEEDLRFVVGCKDQAVTVWSLKTSKVIAYINHYEKSSKSKDRKYPQKGHRQICFWTTNRTIQTNSLCGEVLEWNMENIDKSGDRYVAYRSNARVVCDGFKQINGALMIGPSLLLVQSSQKTLVGVHSKTRDVLFNLPMFHYLNCISPNSSLVAFGGSDIRLWKTDSQNVNYDVQTLWVQSATVVIDIAWHPTKEGLLAFSTDNGQVGFLEALSQNKSPKFSSFRHKKEVYKVLWGPPVSTNSINSDGNFTVYSVGDFKLVQHPFRDSNPVVMNSLLNNQNERELKISQALFHPVDFAKLIVGYFDGTIEVFSFPKLDRLCIVKSIVKMITTIAWHPEYTGISSDPSPLRHYIGVASLHKNANIFDLSEVLVEKEEQPSSTPVVVTKTALIGHEGTIFNLCWSPFEDGRVLTVARDYTAMVWDAITGTALSVFNRHPRRLTTCAWHPSNSDLVLTGSEEGTMMCWKVSSYPFSEGKEVHFERRRRKKPNAGHRREGRDGEDTSSVSENVLDEKKTEILSYDQNDQLIPERQGDERVGLRKSKRTVSIFGPAKGAMGRSDGLFEDIESLAKLHSVNEEKQDLIGVINKTSTGMFFTDKKGADIALAQEINRLQQTQAGFEVNVLKCFSGDYGQIVREAIQTSTITDWHVSLAAATGYGLFKEACIAFGNQLAGNGYPVRGSSYLIMVGQVKEAIDLLIKHVEFPSAVALARKRLPEGSPVFKEIYEAWAASTDLGPLESVRPNLALGNLSLAAETLARSDKPEVLKLATSVSKLSGNSELTRVTSIHCARTCVAKGEWKILEELCEEVDVPEVQDIRAKYLEMKLDNLQIGKDELNSLNIKEETGDPDLDQAKS